MYSSERLEEKQSMLISNLKQLQNDCIICNWPKHETRESHE